MWGLSLGTVQCNTPTAGGAEEHNTFSLAGRAAGGAAGRGGAHLCVEERQAPDGVEGDQHFHQELFMFCFQRQSETVDYTGGGDAAKRSKH